MIDFVYLVNYEYYDTIEILGCYDNQDAAIQHEKILRESDFKYIRVSKIPLDTVVRDEALGCECNWELL